MVFTGAIFKIFTNNTFIILIAIILSVLLVNFLYQVYLKLKYPSSELADQSEKLLSKSILAFLSLGLIWIITFAIITVDHGHWENVWGIFITPVFGSLGVGCLWFFGSIRKYVSMHKWLILFLGILFVTLYFPITLIRVFG